MKNIFILLLATVVISLTFFAAGCKKDDKKDDDNTTATCSDGIKNQDETDIDCGGVCAACSTSTPHKYNTPRPMVRSVISNSVHEDIIQWSNTYQYDTTTWKLISMDSFRLITYTLASVNEYDLTSHTYHLLGELAYQRDHPSTPSEYYKYDSDKYRIKKSYVNEAVPTYYYYDPNTRNNIETIFDPRPESPYVQVTTNAFNSNKNTIGNYNFGRYYLGKSSTNLITYSRRVTVLGSDSTLSEEKSYSYTYNDSGWVKTRTIEWNKYFLNPPEVTTIRDTFEYY